MRQELRGPCRTRTRSRTAPCSHPAASGPGDQPKEARPAAAARSVPTASLRRSTAVAPFSRSGSTTTSSPIFPPVIMLGVLSYSRIRPRRPARRPGPPPSLHRPGLLPQRGDPLIVELGGQEGRDLQIQPIRCSSTSIKASVYSTQKKQQTCSASEPGSSTIGIPASRKARVQDRLQLAQLRPGNLHSRRPPPWRPAPPAARPTARAPPPTSAIPGPPYLLIAKPQPRSAPPPQPTISQRASQHKQPATIKISQDNNIQQTKKKKKKKKTKKKKKKKKRKRERQSKPGTSKPTSKRTSHSRARVRKCDYQPNM